MRIEIEKRDKLKESYWKIYSARKYTPSGNVASNSKSIVFGGEQPWLVCTARGSGSDKSSIQKRVTPNLVAYIHNEHASQMSFAVFAFERRSRK